MAPNKLSNVIDSLTTKVSTLEEQLRKAIDAFDDLLTLHGDAITNFEQRIQSLEAANAKATELAALKKDLNSQGMNISELKSSLLKLDSTIEGLSDKHAEAFKVLHDTLSIQQPKLEIKPAITKTNKHLQTPKARTPPKSPLNRVQSTNMKPEAPKSSPAKHFNDNSLPSESPASRTGALYKIPQRKGISKHRGTNPSKIDDCRSKLRKKNPGHPKHLPCLLTMDPYCIFAPKPWSCHRSPGYPNCPSSPPYFHTAAVENPMQACPNCRTHNLLPMRRTYHNPLTSVLHTYYVYAH